MARIKCFVILRILISGIMGCQGWARLSGLSLSKRKKERAKERDRTSKNGIRQKIGRERKRNEEKRR